MAQTNWETGSKEQLRSVYLNQRREKILAGDYIEIGRQIIKRYLCMDFYREAELILCYASTEHELDTGYLLRQAFADGKRVAVPKVLTGKKDGSVMEFCLIRSEEELKIGHFGIREPEREEVVVPECGEMILPGLCFDLAGGRIGYGGGYYDRYLHRYRECRIHKTALAYELQLFPKLRLEETDVPYDSLVTESRYFIV